MKRKPSRKDLLLSCESIGPEDGLDPKTFFRSGSFKRTNRKALQLCGEVARTIGYALAWELGDDLLGQAHVVAVTPAPDSTRLLVRVATSDDADAVLSRLLKVAGRLRTRVAQSIHRRRTPELTFVVVPKEVGPDRS